MAELNFDTSKAYLQGSENGVLYDHFTKLIAKVIDSRPDDPQAAFEILSRFVKSSDGSVPQEGELVPQERIAERANYAEKASNLLKDPSAGEGEGGGAVECAVPNFMEEAEIFEWASVGFGANESYQIMMSLRKLAALEDPKPKKLRLWGKILGSEKDYIVAEGQMEGQGEADAEDPEFEPQGTGANKFTYWVTNDPCGDWVKLGDVRTHHVRQARLIKRVLTGNLGAKVVSHPAFPGDEKALLRAQIARISADTVLCVNGYLAPPEEDEGGAIEENPDILKTATPEILKTKAGWTHCVEHILRNGRTEYVEVGGEGGEGEDDGGAAKELARQKEADPPRSMIRGVAEDKELEWSIRQFGDLATYEGAGVPKASNTITAVRSLTWPGGCCVAKSGGGFANIYVGYGLKAGEPDFFPISPPEIMEEPADPGDQPEPQGEEPPAPAGEEEGGG